MMPRTRALLSSIAGLPAAVEQLHRRLSELHNDVSQIWSLLRNKPEPRRFGTVMLLWKETEPGFASVTLPLEPRGSTSFDIRCDVPVPSGAWLVASGCYLSTVLVGVDLQDLAMPERSPAVRLRDPIPLGVSLRCAVVPS